MADAPITIATIGLHGSASTWVFNVVRELLIAEYGEERVMAVYAETMAELPDEATRNLRHLVVKSHHGSADFDSWLSARPARLILSVRDPRDACLSMSQRFRAPLNQTLRWLAQDCNRMLRLAQDNHPLLRYEDRFFDHMVYTKNLAVALGLSVPEVTIGEIFARYRTGSVRAFAQNLTQLSPGRVSAGPVSAYDRVTQIHSIHIGDTRSGKWRDLPPAVQTEMTRLFAPFLARFCYTAD